LYEVADDVFDGDDRGGITFTEDRGEHLDASHALMGNTP
jgi:hypothetical protein